MKKETYIFLFGIAALVAIYLIGNKPLPTINFKAIKDSLKQQEKKILFSEFKIKKIRRQDSLKTILISKYHAHISEINKAHEQRMEALRRMNKKKIDSLISVFYPDTTKRNLQIAETKINFDHCDSVNKILVKEISAHEEKEKGLEAEIKEYEQVQIPAYKKKDSLHVPIEKGYAQLLLKEKRKRFGIGPYVGVATDGRAAIGIDITYCLFKF